MSDELKPCPFCGDDGKPELIHADVHMWYVKCTKCGVCCKGVQPSDEIAVKTWNTRAECTCKMKDTSDSIPRETVTTTWFCSECGSPNSSDITPSYCINCGAKVVES